VEDGNEFVNAVCLYTSICDTKKSYNKQHIVL